MSPNGNEHPIEEGHPDIRPFLTIPYWSSPVSGGSGWDKGVDRPLPSSVISYLCDAIHASPYTPGDPLEVVVDVRNSGGGSSASVAIIVVYWADPTVGFAKPTFFAASSVAVPPTRSAPGATSTVMRATIPASAPPHICLLVMASHPQDPAGKAADPVGDRHWAQRNLVAVAAAPGAPALIPFVVANPFAQAGGFTLLVAPADERHLRSVADAVGSEPTQLDATIRLLDEEGGEVTDSGSRVRASLELGALERRAFQVLVELAGEVVAGRAAPYELTLLDETGERIVGSLGLVLTSP
jgi:hypothetical protein